MRKLLFFLLFISFCLSSFAAGNRMSNAEYVDSWKQIAVKQMIDAKIPASITLAQGILESGSGNSLLAKKGNNHFGIKCHGWEGEKIFLDDDAKNECFRVYGSAELSYVDHSSFLTGKSRYSNLFNLDVTDYKGWANGLKDAGYATNPKYPSLLIEIIERMNLDELDRLGLPVVESKLKLNVSVKSTRSINIHQNNVQFIVAKSGDTFYKISKEFGIGLWQLYRYNDYDSKKDVLEEGDVVYLQPKRNRAKERKAKFLVSEYKTTMRMISQKEAVKLEKLVNKNDGFTIDQELPIGTEIRLR